MSVRDRMAHLSGLLDRYHDAAGELAIKLNELPVEEWMTLPIEVRVALDVLNPDMRNSSDMERELARYVLTLWSRTEREK